MLVEWSIDLLKLFSTISIYILFHVTLCMCIKRWCVMALIGDMHDKN